METFGRLIWGLENRHDRNLLEYLLPYFHFLVISIYVLFYLCLLCCTFSFVYFIGTNLFSPPNNTVTLVRLLRWTTERREAPFQSHSDKGLSQVWKPGCKALHCTAPGDKCFFCQDCPVTSRSIPTASDLGSKGRVYLQFSSSPLPFISSLQTH